jgi:hypothetical protein
VSKKIEVKNTNKIETFFSKDANRFTLKPKPVEEVKVNSPYLTYMPVTWESESDKIRKTFKSDVIYVFQYPGQTPEEYEEEVKKAYGSRMRAEKLAYQMPPNY